MSKTIGQQWDWDVRVRERNIKAGILSEKEVEKMLDGLEDLAEKMDTVSLAQPALSGGHDDIDEDEEDEVEEDQDAGAEP